MKKSACLVWAGIFGLLLPLALVSYDAVFYLKAFTQFFAPGISSFKTIFFLIWGLVSFLFLAFKRAPIQKDLRKPLLVFIAIVCSINIFSHFLFIRLYKVDPAPRTEAVTNRAISSNQYKHTHTMKSIFMPVVNALEMSKVTQTSDPGEAYYELLPHWIYYLAAPFMFVSLLLFLLVLVQRRGEWEPSMVWGFTFIYVISSYAIVKSFFDGGPLSSEMITYLPLFLVALYTQKKDYLSLGMQYLFGLIISASIGLVIYALINPPDIRILFMQMGLFSLFSVVIFILADIVVNKTYKKLSWVFLLAGVLIWSARGFFWNRAYQLLQTQVGPQNLVFLASYDGENYPFSVRAREGQLIVYAFNPAEDTTIWDIYRSQDIPFQYGRANIAGITCGESSGFMVSGKLIPIESENLDLNKKSDLMDYFNVMLEGGGGSKNYRYDGMVKGCMPSGSDELVVNHLHEVGFRRFILVPDQEVL